VTNTAAADIGAVWYGKALGWALSRPFLFLQLGAAAGEVRRRGLGPGLKEKKTLRPLASFRAIFE